VQIEEHQLRGRSIAKPSFFSKERHALLAVVHDVQIDRPTRLSNRQFGQLDIGLVVFR